ncbi:Sugar transporter [Musa troglodytarum]|uniref:Sugar transporter n=1 Tax=Musa troglodytarum TaxID=320322 RepID=A0A9E7ENC6_9LILI|nr:Sugar transporter [Musa troglodytarum]
MKYRPQLTMAVLIPFFQQLSGINAIMFNAPVSFETIGFGDDASLPHVRSHQWPRQRLRHLFVSIATVDKSGRRRLFLHPDCTQIQASNLSKTHASLIFGLFYFIGGWVLVMTLFIAFFLPRRRTCRSKRRWYCGRSIVSGTSLSPMRMSMLETNGESIVRDVKERSEARKSYNCQFSEQNDKRGRPRSPPGVHSEISDRGL